MTNNKKKLVLIPGWGFDSRVWQPVLSALELRYDVILLTLPSIDAEDDVDEVVAMLAADLPANASYLGWSLGGLIALRLAALFPARVNKLFLAGSTPKFLAINNWPGMVADNFDKFMALVQHDPKQAVTEFVYLQLPAKTNRPIARQLRDICMVNNSNNYEYLLILRNTDLRQDLMQLQCEVQFILGSEDQLVPIAVTENLKQHGKQLKIDTIAGAGHAMFWTHTEQFLAVLSD